MPVASRPPINANAHEEVSPPDLRTGYLFYPNGRAPKVSGIGIVNNSQPFRANEAYNSISHPSEHITPPIQFQLSL